MRVQLGKVGGDQSFTRSLNVMGLVYLVAAVGEGEGGGNVAVQTVGIATEEGHFVGGSLAQVSAQRVVELTGDGAEGEIAAGDGIQRKGIAVGAGLCAVQNRFLKFCLVNVELCLNFACLSGGRLLQGIADDGGNISALLIEVGGIVSVAFYVAGLGKVPCRTLMVGYQYVIVLFSLRAKGGNEVCGNVGAVFSAGSGGMALPVDENDILFLVTVKADDLQNLVLLGFVSNYVGILTGI